MSDLEELQKRVEQYFQCGQRNEPGGRLILDLMRTLRERASKNEQLRAEYERVCYQREGLLNRIATLRGLLQKTLDEGWVDYSAELSNEIVAELGGKP